MDNWKISISPMLNAAINKWVYDVNIEKLGKSSAQNFEFKIGDSTIKGRNIEPNKSISNRGSWITKDTKKIDISLSWLDEDKQINGEATYNVKQK